MRIDHREDGRNNPGKNPQTQPKKISEIKTEDDVKTDDNKWQLKTGILMAEFFRLGERFTMAVHNDAVAKPTKPTDAVEICPEPKR